MLHGSGIIHIPMPYDQDLTIGESHIVESTILKEQILEKTLLKGNTL